MMTMADIDKVLEESLQNRKQASEMFKMGAADFYKPHPPRYPDDPEYMAGWKDSEGCEDYLREMEWEMTEGLRYDIYPGFF